MRYGISLKDYIISLFIGLVITLVLAPTLAPKITLTPYSIEWVLFHAVFFFIVSHITYICYRALFIPPTTPPTVPKRILSFDETIRKSEYNFCAISSKEIALWKSPTFLYYLILNDIKNIIEYNLKNKVSIIRFSQEAVDKREFFNEGLNIIKKIADEKICPEFYGIRLLIYPENVFNDYANEIQTLIQMHAIARVHSIPVIREKLVAKLTNEERNTLDKFAKQMKQKITDEYTAISRVERIRLYFARKQQSNPYSVRIPDFLIINYNPFDRSEESVWWYVQEKVNQTNETSFIKEAEECYKIICRRIDENVLWDQYTPEIFGMIPVGEPIKYMKVDFFSQDYFEKWLSVIKNNPEFNKLKEWLEKEDWILEKLISENEEIKTVLDVGCGRGRHMEIMLKNSRIEKVVGVDKSPVMVEKANQLYKKYGNERPLIKLEDAQNMMFDANTFDLVICMTNTFGNFGNNIKIKVLDEMIRVLKPGGRIILSVYKDSPNALELRKKSYLSIGLHLFLAEDKRTIIAKEGLLSEQFKEDEIISWLAKKKLGPIDTVPINDVAFIVTALK